MDDITVRLRGIVDDQTEAVVMAYGTVLVTNVDSGQYGAWDVLRRKSGRLRMN